MKPYRGLTIFVFLLSGLALAACGANGGGAQPPTAAAPAATQPANSPAAPTESVQETLVAYPFGTPTPGMPGYPLATPGAGAYPYPYPVAPGTPPAAQGQPVDAAVLDLVKQNLAKRLSVTVDEITVVSATSREWPDSSLGCPQPGMAYAQIVTPGYRIVLGQGQKQYDYHTDLSATTIVLCTP
jgi:hypothetical protein